MSYSNLLTKQLSRNHQKTVMNVIIGACIFVLSASAYSQEPALDSSRKDEIANMVLQDCGSCHGMTLKGGLGPALTPEILKDKHNDMLVGTILYGRSGTAMPPWNTFLTENEARWIVDQLKQGKIKR